jgi:hypothetical protein
MRCRIHYAVNAPPSRLMVCLLWTMLIGVIAPVGCDVTASGDQHYVRVRVEPFIPTDLGDRVTGPVTVYVDAPGARKVKVYVQPVDLPFGGKRIGKRKLIGVDRDSFDGFSVPWAADEPYDYVEVFARAYGQPGVRRSRKSPRITILLDWRRNPPAAYSSFLIAQTADRVSTGRDKYRAFDLARDPLLATFVREYKAARDKGAAWVKDPKEVAARMAGYPNVTDLPPKSWSLLKTGRGRVTVRVFSGDLKDDSLAESETRVDFIRRWNALDIEWAGQRWRCRRPSLSDWTNELCP